MEKRIVKAYCELAGKWVTGELSYINGNPVVTTDNGTKYLRNYIVKRSSIRDVPSK